MTGDAAEAAALGVEVQESRLTRLFAEHAPRATRLAYLLTGDRDTADDIVQDAFVRVAGRFADLRDPLAFPAYLRRTVINLTRMHHRKLSRERGEPAPLSPVHDPDVAQRESVRRALRALPERQRAAIVLRYYEDLSEADIATALRCRPGTVKSLLSRGSERLRGLLGGDDDE